MFSPQSRSPSRPSTRLTVHTLGACLLLAAGCGKDSTSTRVSGGDVPWGDRPLPDGAEIVEPERLEELRAGRDESRCQATLQALAEGAKGDANLLQLAIGVAEGEQVT